MSTSDAELEETFETIADQLEIQNAALVEIANALRRANYIRMGRDPDEHRQDRLGHLEDNALNIRESVDLDELDRWEER